MAYGSASSIRAAERLHGSLSELKIAHVSRGSSPEVADTPLTDAPESGAGPVETMLEQFAVQTRAMEAAREGQFNNPQITPGK